MSSHLTEIFTGVIAVVALFTVIRGIPNRKDMDILREDIKALRQDFHRIVNRLDRHLEYHSYTKED